MVPDVNPSIDTKVVARLLRGLAIDVETNAALAVQLIEALAAIGLLDEESAGELSGLHPMPSATDGPNASIAPGVLMSLQAAKIDLLMLYRTGGAEQVRERLGILDLAALRRIIQVQELDPEKKVTKVRSVAKLIDYIVEYAAAQVEQELQLAKTNSWML